MANNSDFAENIKGGCACAKRERSAKRKDLTNTNKVLLSELGKRSIIRNKVTGEVIVIDPAVARITHLRKRVFSWAEVLKFHVQSKKILTQKVMLGLTYKNTADWRANHIRAFMLDLRKILGENLLGYAWVAELQARGAVHYHVLLIIKKNTHVPKPDKTGLWKYGNTNLKTAKSIFYICTYVGKEYQKMGYFPKGLRMFAVWLDRSIVSERQVWQHKLSSVPAWFREIIEANEKYHFEKWDRIPGGGFQIAGDVISSPYEFLERVKLRF